MWEPTGYSSYNYQNWTSPWFERIHMPHILGPIAVSFIEYDDLLVKDATKLEPIFDEQLEAEDLCHGTK